MAQSQEKPDVEQGGLERKMETRHLTMISLGGVIGTGLFLSSGYTIHQAGPTRRDHRVRHRFACSSTSSC